MDDPELVRLSKSDLKKIKYFVFFASIILLSQIFQFINARHTNNKFKTILAAENRFIIAMNTISVNSSSIHRSLLSLAISDDEKEAVAMLKRIEDAEKSTEETISQLEKSMPFPESDHHPLFDELREAGKEYSQQSFSFMDLLKTRNKAAIDSFRINQLRSARDSYLKVQRDMIQEISDRYIAESDSISQSAGKTGWILLIAGNAVLIFVLIFLIYLIFNPNTN